MVIEGARIEIGPRGQVVVYIDDIALWAGADAWQDLWRRTLITIRALTQAGFMVNIRKSKLLVRRATLVGMEIEEGFYRPIAKPIQKLFGTQPPRTRAGLQQLLG